MEKECRHCNSKSLIFSKGIGYDWGRHMVIYVYRVKCETCKKTYSVKRNEEHYLFFKANVKEWIKSKSYTEYERKGDSGKITPTLSKLDS